MIEVEKKFQLTEEDRERLIADTEFVSEKTFTDIYYDTADYKLTSHDQWLRARDGRFELKLPLHSGPERVADQYEELEAEDQIKAVLGFTVDGNLEELLQSNGYEPFATLTTARKKYKKDPFLIDLDIVDFGNSEYYTLGEIEMMVADESEMTGAIEKIVDFANENGLSLLPVRGKLIEYIKRLRPEHYKALVDAKAIQDLG